jgi:hypothetical protein
MIPDKPGFWWCMELPERTETIVEVINVTSSSLSNPGFMVRVIGHFAEYDLDFFSKSVEWISEAVPPLMNDEEKNEAK